MLNSPSRRGLILGAAGLLVGAGSIAAEEHKVAAKATVKPAAAKAISTPVQTHAVAEHVTGIDPEVALERLIAGNARYVSGFSTHPHGDIPRRSLVASGQTPFATILACADSRVAPELIFDQGLGDLFVCRVAGNVIDDALLASLEYSVIHLGSTLIMVLGHERCGAVKATLDALEGHGSPEDVGTKIGSLANLISPAVRAVPASSTDRLNDAVSLNAANAAADVFVNSVPLRNRVLSGKLKIVAARYDLDDGTISPTRAQTSLAASFGPG